MHVPPRSPAGGGRRRRILTPLWLHGVCAATDNMSWMVCSKSNYLMPPVRRHARAAASARRIASRVA